MAPRAYPCVVNQCAECGFDYGALEQSRLAGEITQQAALLASITTRSSTRTLRTRSRPDVWSPLEYACHVRDVLEVQRLRVREATTTQRPVFSSMRREELLAERRYNESDPAAVAQDVVTGATVLADLLDSLTPPEWAAEGIYNFPTTQARSVEWIARHTVHEVVHHLRDLELGCRTNETTGRQR